MARFEQSIKECLLAVSRHKHHLFHKLVELTPRSGAALTPFKLIIDFEFTRRQNRNRDFRERLQRHFTFEARERCVLHPVETYRQNHRIRFISNHAGAFIDFHQCACFGQAAFREDHAMLVFLDFLDQ